MNTHPGPTALVVLTLALAACATGSTQSGFGSMAANHAADVAAQQHNCPRDRVRVVGDGGDWQYWLDVCGHRRLYDTRNGYHDITASVTGPDGAGGSSGGETR